MMGEKRDRLLYIDTLRLLMIVLVVVFHVALTYVGYTDWYYAENEESGYYVSAFFSFFLVFSQGYFMGFLFLLAGYFVPGAYDRKGFGQFIRDRLVRLGIPALIYMFIINPFLEYVQLGGRRITPVPPNFLSYLAHYTIRLDFLRGSGPLWFALALLVFSFIYAIIRLAFHRTPPSRKSSIRFTTGKAVCLILIIAAIAFAIRLWQPIGVSIFNMKLCFFAQYIVLFVVGILAYRHDLFSQIGYTAGKRWLVLAVVPGFGLWAALMLLGTGGFDGGLTWQAAAYALWESAVCVAMCVGLLGVFRERFNRQSPLVKILSDNSFAVYVFHTPILIAIALWFAPVHFAPIVKFGIVSVLCLILCFAFTHFIVRRIPLLKHIM